MIIERVRERERKDFFNERLFSHELLEEKETQELIEQARKDFSYAVELIKQREEKKERNKIVITDKDMGGVSAAMDKILLHNLRLVKTIALRIYNELPAKKRAAICIDDLEQTGLLAVRYAVLKFDGNHQCKFSTYAAYWIKHFIGRMIIGEDFVVLRVPSYMRQLGALCRKFLAKAEAIGVDPDRPLRFFGGMSMCKIKDMAAICERAISFEERVRTCDGDMAYEELIADPRTEHPGDEMDGFEVRDILNRLLKEADLSEKEMVVIFDRFGIGNGQNLTLTEIGKYYQVSRQRILQLKERALEKLRRAYEIIYGKLPAAAEKKESEKIAKKRGGAKIGRSKLIGLLQLIKPVRGRDFLKVLNMTPKKAEPIIAKHIERHKRCKEIARAKAREKAEQQCAQ